MTEQEIKQKAVDLYNAIVGANSSGLTIRFEGGQRMEVQISQEVEPPKLKFDAD